MDKLTFKDEDWMRAQLDCVGKVKCSNCVHGNYKEPLALNIVITALQCLLLFCSIVIYKSSGFSMELAPSLIPLVMVTFFRLAISRPSSWRWCENKPLEIMRGSAYMNHLESIGYYPIRNWRKEGVPIIKAEENKDGHCFYYKRKWWKFWVKP